MSEERAIVAFNPCGCWAGVVMEHSPSAAEWALGWIKNACRVETMSVEDARRVVTRCDAHPRPERVRQAVLL